MTHAGSGRTACSHDRDASRATSPLHRGRTGAPRLRAQRFVNHDGCILAVASAPGPGETRPQPRRAAHQAWIQQPRHRLARCLRSAEQQDVLMQTARRSAPAHTRARAAFAWPCPHTRRCGVNPRVCPQLHRGSAPQEWVQLSSHWCPGTCCCSRVSRFMPPVSELSDLPRRPLWEDALQDIIETSPGVRLWRFLTVKHAVLA